VGECLVAAEHGRRTPGIVHAHPSRHGSRDARNIDWGKLRPNIYLCGSQAPKARVNPRISE
jgi:hypothetical protein